ncbi:MAG: hypothetical protein GKR97_03470 [Rhizobiaceae bacterium]|nr:hypothetical protein [Rhizobiaceae bacterium]
MNTVKITTIAIAASTLAALNFALPVSTADARPSTRSYSCEALKDLIYDRGAIVMNHKNSSLYRRFVHSRQYCRRPDNSTKRFRVPSKTGTCYLRVCYEQRNLFND